MWVKVEDLWLIGMLQAIPVPWPEAAILAWLTYAARCVASEQPYWLPPWASDRAKERAQRCKLPGRASLVDITGCGRKTAQRCLETIRQRQGQGFRKGSAGVQEGFRKGSGRSTKASTTTDRQPSPGFRKGSAGVQPGFRQGPTTSTGADSESATSQRSPVPRARIEKTREEKKNKGRATASSLKGSPRRKTVNLAALAPPRPSRHLGRVTWRILAGALQIRTFPPRSYGTTPQDARRIRAGLKTLGDGEELRGWHRALELVQGADGAPEPWFDALGCRPAGEG